MKILVTGATGYFGAEIIRALSASGEHTVIALTRHPEKFQRLCHWGAERATCLQVLIGDVSTLKHLPTGIETIIHAAARRDVRECEQHPAETVQVNVQGTCNLLRLAACHGTRRFIYISSQSVYGGQSSPWNEQMQADPQGVYAVTKYAGEQLVWAFRDALDLTVLRLSRIYGVSLFMRWGEIIGKFVQMIYHGRPMPVYGDGTQRFDLVHIRDAAQCVVRLLHIYPDGWNDTYNIGGGGSVSLNELIECLAQVATELGLSTVAIQRHPKLAPSGPLHLELDITRARTKLGWTPRQSLREGLREYLTTYSRSWLEAP